MCIAQSTIPGECLLHPSPSPCWSAPTSLPALCPLPAATDRLFLFYSESRKSLTPGGDVKLAVSADCGETWGAPQLLYAHEAEGEVPKVCGSRLTVAKDGSWYLPGARRARGRREVGTHGREWDAGAAAWAGSMVRLSC